MILNQVLHDNEHPSGIVALVFGDDPTTWVVLRLDGRRSAS